MVERLDDDEEPRRLLGRRSRPRSPRHVTAVPTNAQLKIGRALELFNASEHPRTVAGIARTLGIPHASASTSKSSAAEVLLTVAWELSWYQFGVDLSDGREPVRPRGQGQELSELPPEAQDWNCTVDANGRIELGNGSAEEAEADEPEVRGLPGRQSDGGPAGTARIVTRRAPRREARDFRSRRSRPIFGPRAMGPGRSASFPGEL